MKIAAGIGLLLAVVFVLLAVTPIFNMQDTADAIAGLDAPTESVFNNVGNIAVIIAGLIAVIFVVLVLAYVIKGSQ